MKLAPDWQLAPKTFVPLYQLERSVRSLSPHGNRTFKIITVQSYSHKWTLSFRLGSKKLVLEVAATISSLWISWSDVFFLDATPLICSGNINIISIPKINTEWMKVPFVTFKLKWCVQKLQAKSQGVFFNKLPILAMMYD